MRFEGMKGSNLTIREETFSRSAMSKHVSILPIHFSPCIKIDSIINYIYSRIKFIKTRTNEYDLSLPVDVKWMSLSDISL